MRSSPTRRDERDRFPSSNPLGIPDLLPHLLADEIPGGLEIYGTRRFRTETGKTLAFFTDDYRFKSVWSFPSRARQALIKQQWASVCEPDFSVWRDWPLVRQQNNVYRSRWCARYWQEAGIRIVPCLNWSTRSSLAWSLLGIPVGAPLVAIETQTCAPQFHDDFDWGLARALDVLQPHTLLIYGDASHEVRTPPGVNAVRVVSRCGAVLGEHLHR